MALWTPSAISPHTWIDFSDTSTLFDATTGGNVVTNGVGIARAEDKSGNGRNFTQAISGSRFTFTSNVQNGLGVARADGGDWLTSTLASSVWNFLHNSGSTVFVVIKNGTNSDPQAVYGWMGTNAGTSANIGYSIAYDDRNLLTGLTDAFNANCTSGGGVFPFRSVSADGLSVVTDFRNIITPNAFGVFCVRGDPANATASNRLKLSVNGGSLVGNNQMTGATTTSNATFTLQIGINGNGGVPLTGDYCEVVIFNSLLSIENQQLMEGYLAWKWGTQVNLPANHPYRFAAPGSRFRSRFSTRYTYKPPKAKVFEGVRVRDHDYASLRQGLVGAWCPSLPNGGSGNTLPDQSGRGNHGTLTNMGPEDWVSGQYGRALDFDGTDDYLETVSQVNYGFNGDCTFSAWVYVTGAGNEQTIAALRMGATGNYYIFLRARPITGSFGFVFFNNSENVGCDTLSFISNTWVHVAGRRQGNSIQCFLNGVPGNASTWSFAAPSYSHLSFGGTPGFSRWFSGQLDDIRIYNRALTEPEIRLLASRRGIGLQPSPTRFIAREKKTGLRRKILTGQT